MHVSVSSDTCRIRHRLNIDTYNTLNYVIVLKLLVISTRQYPYRIRIRIHVS